MSVRLMEKEKERKDFPPCKPLCSSHWCCCYTSTPFFCLMFALFTENPELFHLHTHTHSLYVTCAQVNTCPQWEEALQLNHKHFLTLMCCTTRLFVVFRSTAADVSESRLRNMGWTWRESRADPESDKTAEPRDKCECTVCHTHLINQLWDPWSFNSLPLASSF